MRCLEHGLREAFKLNREFNCYMMQDHAGSLWHVCSQV